MSRYNEVMEITQTTETHQTITVPLLFFKDHMKRGCVEYSGEPEQFIKSENKRQITVTLHIDDIKDLMSDAEYYGSKYGLDRDCVRSICGSATSTVRSLERQGFERLHPNYRVF